MLLTKFQYFTRDHSNLIFCKNLVVLILILFSISTKVFCRPASFGLQNAAPVNGNFLGSQAILFTPLPSAACLNAATLPGTESFTALELAYSPKRGDDPQNFYTGIATSSKSFGVGFGYFGALGDKKTTNGGFVGAGFRSDLSRYGFTYRSLDFTSGGLGNFDLSYVYYDPRESISYGGVLHSLNQTQQIDFGLGYVSDKTFNMELDLSAPPLKQFISGDIVIKAATNFNITSQISSHLEVNFHTKPSKIAPLIALTYSISEFAYSLIQYASPNIWSLGISLVF